MSGTINYRERAKMPLPHPDDGCRCFRCWDWIEGRRITREEQVRWEKETQARRDAFVLDLLSKRSNDVKHEDPQEPAAIED